MRDLPIIAHTIIDNKYEIYEIKSNDKDFSVTGYYFSSKSRDILFVKNIYYNDIYVGTTKELKTQRLLVLKLYLLPIQIILNL